MDAKVRSFSIIGRKELAKAVHNRCPSLTRQEAHRMVDETLYEITDALAAGEEVKLSGFGVFRLREKEERMGRNPNNGVPARISARRVVTFRPSLTMVASINRLGALSEQ